MSMSHRLAAALFLTAAAALAGALSTAGLALLLGPFNAWWLASGVSNAFGVASLAAGQFLFLAAVADRCFPKADPRLTGTFELAFLAVFLASLLALVSLAVTLP
ncbi:MAG: hypothetical protein HRU70_01280 [Phycisphaeraceae bacterium]|nr:MAG: hypothetical protein HRU70_01280 [Phycisphaeraceae bacterium]